MPVVHDFWNPAASRCHDSSSSRHRLKNGERHAFARRCKHKDIKFFQDIANIGPKS